MQEGTRVLAVALSNDVFNKLDDYSFSMSSIFCGSIMLRMESFVLGSVTLMLKTE